MNTIFTEICTIWRGFSRKCFYLGHYIFLETPCNLRTCLIWGKLGCPFLVSLALSYSFYSIDQLSPSSNSNLIGGWFSIISRFKDRHPPTHLTKKVKPSPSSNSSLVGGWYSIISRFKNSHLPTYAPTHLTRSLSPSYTKLTPSFNSNLVRDWVSIIFEFNTNHWHTSPTSPKKSIEQWHSEWRESRSRD